MKSDESNAAVASDDATGDIIARPRKQPVQEGSAEAPVIFFDARLIKVAVNE